LVRCELDTPQAGADRAAVAGALQQRIKTLIGISTMVDVGAPESIERTLVGKAVRVVDKRPK
jgi:phenylacetate-CoA ligase